MEKPRPRRIGPWLKMIAAFVAASTLLVVVLAWISTESWGTIHLGPTGALDALARLHAKTLVPIHWSTFVLAYHGWSEPAEALLQEADKRGVSVLTPRLGEPIEPTAATPGASHAWWRALPPIAARCP